MRGINPDRAHHPEERADGNGNESFVKEDGDEEVDPANEAAEAEEAQECQDGDHTCATFPSAMKLQVKVRRYFWLGERNKYLWVDRFHIFFLDRLR